MRPYPFNSENLVKRFIRQRYIRWAVKADDFRMICFAVRPMPSIEVDCHANT
jgi:hypothetical protein